jgi:carboxyl-terminal processing protease
MPKINAVRRFALPSVLAASALWLAAGSWAPVARGVEGANPPAVATTADVSEAIWRSARDGKGELALAEPLRGAPLAGAPALAGLRGTLDALEANFAKRETARREQVEKVEKELTEATSGEQTPANLSKGLKAAVELYLLTTDKQAFLAQDRLKQLVERADAAAHQAESKADWIMANELFVRLNLLLEEQGKYKADVRRLTDRLMMIQLYVPEQLYRLRNARRLEEGLKPLPPFNATGEDYKGKLAGINDTTVLRAVLTAAKNHVERKPLRQLLTGGLESVRNMATTRDLEAAFPGIANPTARDGFIAFIDAKINDLRTAAADPSAFATSSLIDDLLSNSASSVKIPNEAILHEFGNGAFDRLDEFSQIIWPDEMNRFRRITDGQFIGVGVQIQLDEETQMIKVVVPLEGTPAFRAGLRAGDLIKKIDDKPALGLSLNQAVELITGKAGTKVKLTMERAGEDIDFLLNREVIPLRTVKGWRRTGPKEDQWDWFVDPQAKIGYLRLTNFQESTANGVTTSTTREMRDAIAQMKKDGLQGLILDLRFNPGGLLNQAVDVANTFVEDGMIVYTEATGGVRTEEHKAKASGLRVKDIPIVVLINEGSASASEIVSGALKHYGDTGKIRCVLIGARSFGKGSVQNVLDLSNNARMKLTTQYYFLPNGQLIHRREGATTWGVQPHVVVEMLPKQISDSLLLRQDADTPTNFLAADQKDKDGKPREQPNPDRLLTEGLDLQLQHALFLLQSQTVGRAEANAVKPGDPAKAG